MQLQYRVIIQKEDGSKYYPQLVDCTTNGQYPFVCPSATIELATASTLARQHLSPVRTDDIIRAQWSMKTNSSQKTIWRDLFSGRIMAPIANHGDNTNITLLCRGHAEEAVYRAVKTDYSASNTTTGAMLATIVNNFLSRITDDSGNSFIDSEDSSEISSYNIEAKTKYVADAIREFEILENKNYRFRTLPLFDASGNIEYARAVWEQLPSTANPKVRAIEGTGRYIGSWFQDSIESLVNDVTIFGATGSPQKVGTSTNTASQSKYNTRDHIDTDLTLGSDSLCESLATAIDTVFNAPIRSGQVFLQLSPDLLPGDLLYCKVPSLFLSGASIDDSYRVVRVSHSTRLGVTTVDIGRVFENTYDVLASFNSRLRLNNANLIG